MESFLNSPHKLLWKRVVLTFFFVFVLSACTAPTPKKASTQITPTYAAPTATHASSPCTSLATHPGNQGADAAILGNIPTAGNPFKAVATNDDAWIFVSINTSTAATSGIAVFHKQGAQICLLHMLPHPNTVLGMTLTRDNSILVVADYSDIAFVDVKAAENGSPNALLGAIPEKSSSSTIEVALSQDEHYLFTANENDATVSVIDFRRVRTHDFGKDALLGQIPVGTAPVGLAVSPDDRYLYITSELDTNLPSQYALGNTCQGLHQGSLSVFSLATIGHASAYTVLTRVPAGCSPVRVILSPTGDIAWVAVRGNDELLAFATSRLVAKAPNTQLATVAVGSEPVGMALVDNGKLLVVANSSRFQAPTQPQTLTVLDTVQALKGKAAILATLHVGAFPRELSLATNGQTLLLTNYSSDTVSVIDVAKLPTPTTSN